MITHVWSVLCQNSIIDQDSNLVSLINSIEELTLPDEPAPNKVYPITVSLVTLWIRSDINIPISGFGRSVFTSPNGEELQSLEQELDLKNYERLRTRSYFSGLKLSEAGQYYFNVEYRDNVKQEWRKVAALPVKVSFKKE
jgi:hypothetical protein